MTYDILKYFESEVKEILDDILEVVKSKSFPDYCLLLAHAGYQYENEGTFLVHPTFRVMRQSCSAYSLSSKYRSSLNPYAVLFITFILLLIPSTFPVDIWQSYHASIPVRWAMMVAAIFISCGTLLSWACFTQSSNMFSASSLFTCVQTSLSCSFR